MSKTASDNNGNANGNGNGNGFNFATPELVHHSRRASGRRNRATDVCRQPDDDLSFSFQPFLVTPQHDHPHEQMTIVERGRCGFSSRQGTDRVGGRRAALSIELLARRHDDG